MEWAEADIILTPPLQRYSLRDQFDDLSRLKHLRLEVACGVRHNVSHPPTGKRKYEKIRSQPAGQISRLARTT
jgi:hypothetical protein